MDHYTKNWSKNNKSSNNGLDRDIKSILVPWIAPTAATEDPTTTAERVLRRIFILEKEIQAAYFKAEKHEDAANIGTMDQHRARRAERERAFEKLKAIIMEAWQVVKSDLATLGVHTATKPLLSQSQMNNKLQETVRFSFMDRLKMKTRDASSAAQQASNQTSVQSIKNKLKMSLFHVCQHSKLMNLKPGECIHSSDSQVQRQWRHFSELLTKWFLRQTKELEEYVLETAPELPASIAAPILRNLKDRLAEIRALDVLSGQQKDKIQLEIDILSEFADLRVADTRRK